MDSQPTVEERLARLEDQVGFIMRTMRMAVTTGLIDKKTQHYSLLDLYISARTPKAEPKSELT